MAEVPPDFEAAEGGAEVEVGETLPSPPTPHQRAQALFDTLPEPSAGLVTATDYDKAPRTHHCPDGSSVRATDVYGDGNHYKFIVYGPAEGPHKELGDSRIELDFSQNIEAGQENLGSIRLPELPIMLGEEQIATIPQSGTPVALNEPAQHAALDWAHGIVENDRYSPLGLTVPVR
ncbi:MAG TPA: hypothetical protein VD772_01970 [Anseongella sp.]|nr:hypothetical protein [Anseongella sp.]